MSEGDELLGKADALLSKYRPAPAQDFPVLTDIIELPEEPRSPGEVPSPPPSDESAQNEELDRELQELELDLRRKILVAIEPVVASFLGEQLEQRIRTRLETALERIAGEVAVDIRAEASELILKAVAEAVENELAGLRASIDKP